MKQFVPPNLSLASDAVLSPCGGYRFWLHRSWVSGRGWVVFVMVNPSSADETKNDPTMNRVIAFAKEFGFNGVIVVNLFAARSKEIDALLELDDPVGRQWNDDYIRHALTLSDTIICAWGSHRVVHRRDYQVLKLIRAAGLQPKCLRLGKHGMPAHPLYLPQGLKLQEYHG
jgi:hypothetical protein